ncbi:MAG: DNRLRE domain-containing protein, partial [Chloroflexota bacterium]
MTLFPIADVSLYGESGNLGNGAGEHLFAGFTNQGNERRALVRFDLSSIPADATVTSVRLELTVDRTQAGPLSYGLHRVTTSWSEGVENAGDSEGRGASNPSGATWTRATLTTHWGAPGGDFETNASGSATVDALGTGVSWESAGLVADVQAWL